jgi:thiamine biosynthesis lipoprotein
MRVTPGAAAGWRRAALVGLVAVAAVWFARSRSAAPPPSPRSPTAFEGATMGTTYRVLLARSVPEARRTALQRGVDSLLRDVNASMSTYDPASELSRLNAREDTLPIPVSAPLALVLRTSASVHAASGGRFDVTVGPLVDAWGFGPAARPTDSLADSVVARLRATVGMSLLALVEHAEGAAVAKREPRVRLDLSAVAKGYGVDVVSDWLLAQGERAHLVEIGGEMRARGRNAAGLPFRVGIEDADPEARRVRFAIGLEDLALASSGNYRNWFELDGQRYAHTIDPALGRPVRHRLLAASVLHPRCADADAWATALMVAGPDSAWALAGREGLEVALLIAGPGGEVEERLTAGFAARRLAPPVAAPLRNVSP